MGQIRHHEPDRKPGALQNATYTHGRAAMIYIPNIKHQIEELFPQYLRRELTNQEINEMHSLIDEVVWEAREPRSAFVEKSDRPELFLVNLLEPFIKNTVAAFLKNHPGENPRSEWSEWMQYATLITSSLIVGDDTEREDRRKAVQPYLNSFVRGEDRQLFLAGRAIRARLKECLNQVVKDHEFFVNPLPWAEQCALSEGSKAYNPDYNSEKREDLELQKEMAEDLIDRWDKGEFRDEFPTRSELLDYINIFYIDTPFEELDGAIARTEKNTHLIGYLFGQEGFGYLFWRLSDLHKYLETQKLNVFKYPDNKEIDEGENNKSPFDISIDVPLDIAFPQDASPEDIIIEKESLEPDQLCETQKDSATTHDNTEFLYQLGLTPKQIRVYVFHALENRSFSDIGNIMGMSRQNAHRLYNKAVSKIPTKTE